MKIQIYFSMATKLLKLGLVNAGVRWCLLSVTGSNYTTEDIPTGTIRCYSAWYYNE